MVDLSGRKALVTGSVQGIGLAVVEALAGVFQRIGLALDSEPVLPFDRMRQFVGALSQAFTTGASPTGRAPGRNRRVKKSSQLVKPKWSAPGSQTKLSMKYCRGSSVLSGAMALNAALLNQPPCPSLRTSTESEEPRKRAHSPSTTSRCRFTSLRKKAEKPPAVHIDQSRVALIGKPTRPVSLSSGACVMIRFSTASITR